VKPRITAPVDDSVRVALTNDVSPLARLEFDQGEALAGTEMRHVRFFLQRSSEQEAALDAYLAELQDPSSPNYHKWLTPEQFGELYGPADADIAAITGWLEGQGFSGIQVPKGRTTVEFSGPVRLMEQVFQTSIHSFKMGEKEFLANTTAPWIPAALATVVTGVADMNTLQPEKNFVVGPRGSYDPAAKRFVRVDGESGSNGIKSEYSGTMFHGDFLYLTPSDAALLYNTPNKALNPNFTGTTSYDGTGVKIGIVGDSGLKTAGLTPVTTYAKDFLKNALNVTVNNLNDVTTTNGLDGLYADIEIAGGLAPGAAITVYTDSNLTTAMTTAVNDNAVDILEFGFATCEHAAGNTLNATIASTWKQAAMEGVAVVVSAGNEGSATCDQKDSPEADMGLAVNAYASTPYNIAVGGSDTYGLVGDFSTYVSSTDSASSMYRTLIKAVPQSAWNDSQKVAGPISAAVPTVFGVDGGGGGASGCMTQSTLATCTAGYAKPTWQTGKGVPDDKVRDVPDLSLMAGFEINQAGWLLCSADAGASCVAEAGGALPVEDVGGTSPAASAFAGMLALVEQKTGARLGLPTTEIYKLYNSSFASAVFKDITVGNNSVPCTSGSPNCSLNTAGHFFQTGYNAGVGYDQATGLGTVDATGMVNDWGAKVLPAATVSVKTAAASVFRGDSLSVSVDVSGGSGTPTGTVKLSGGGYTSAAATLSAGAAKILIPASSLTVGSDTLTVTYSGGTSYASASGSAKVTVTQLTPTVKATPAAATEPRAHSLAVAVDVTAAVGVPTGTVKLTGGGYTSAATALVSGKATITIPADKLTLAADKLTVTYDGSANYKTASGSATVTVTKLTPTVTVTPSVKTALRSDSLSVAIKATAADGTPTGTVTLTSGSYKSAATALKDGKATIVVAALKLGAAKDTLTATYSGDVNDNTAAGHGTVTVSKLTPTVTVTPITSSATSTSSLSVAIKVTATSGTPTGSVVLTSGSYTSAATALSAGKKTSILIPAGKLAVGTDTLTVTYSGDSYNNKASGTAKVTITQ